MEDDNFDLYGNKIEMGEMSRMSAYSKFLERVKDIGFRPTIRSSQRQIKALETCFPGTFGTDGDLIDLRQKTSRQVLAIYKGYAESVRKSEEERRRNISYR